MRLPENNHQSRHTKYEHTNTNTRAILIKYTISIIARKHCKYHKDERLQGQRKKFQTRLTFCSRLFCLGNATGENSFPKSLQCKYFKLIIHRAKKQQFVATGLLISWPPLKMLLLGWANALVQCSKLPAWK